MRHNWEEQKLSPLEAISSVRSNALSAVTLKMSLGNIYCYGNKMMS